MVDMNGFPPILTQIEMSHGLVMVVITEVAGLHGLAITEAVEGITVTVSHGCPSTRPGGVDKQLLQV